MGSLEPFDIQSISKAKPIEPQDLYDSLRGGTLPTMLLYNERGLQLFEKITYNEHYYLTNSEIDILKRQSHVIAEQIKGSIIIELGSGALRKTSLILKAVEELGVSTDYYALDLDRRELERSLTSLVQLQQFKHVKLHGLHADYNDIHAFLKKHDQRVTILWMGSSVGNFSRDGASTFLLSLKESMKPNDMMLVGVDNRNAPDLVYTAYNDPEGDSERFEMNGLEHANQILGREVLRQSDWQYKGLYNQEEGYHEAAFQALNDVHIADDLKIEKDTLIRIERSYKYSNLEALALFDRSELNVAAQWKDSRDLYSLYLLTTPPAYLSRQADTLKPVPSLAEWEQLWKLWDTITLGMIPQEMLLCKPIDLRHPCIFYLGHIPTFLDIHLTRVGNGKYTNDAYTRIFERGIDPDVDDPTHCHAHSDVPDTWPDLQEILAFRDTVRNRLREVYRQDTASFNRQLARALFVTFEHEAMHAETLLYMLLQSAETRPPPGVLSSLPTAAAPELEPAAWITLETSNFEVGMDDPEEAESGQYFGWDNEKPRRSISHAKVAIQARPISNGEYAAFLDAHPKLAAPASWTQSREVKTVFGPVPLTYAADWPVAASYDELQAYAKWKDARLPSFAELRHFLDDHSGESSNEPFNNVLDKNVNFGMWHPSSLTSSRESVQTYTGFWEWTSTEFSAPKGFVPSKVYPAYSSDFFDGKHNIVLGGSWATITRIAARKSFVNWYQRNYKFAWTSGRLARDL
ncbi:C-type lectin protein [Protomyces lactucae-debilis]|uniref:C-type lectin protein n=1 Tax=Protomyces lactucae-debilis TaxID=2754530 RepID=A0A1Y2FD53_PROLT|nr:C-type lectin protein [Protomyces lactucae-debilis]ORY81537.1 C-type lectin protein [Protomyces lactucae-debilis]